MNCSKCGVSVAPDKLLYGDVYYCDECCAGFYDWLMSCELPEGLSKDGKQKIEEWRKNEIQSSK